MAWNSEYPYVDSKMYNDDWLLRTIKKLIKEIDDFVNLNKIKYANPIGWDITRQYETNTVVVDNRTGNAYISVRPVPSGVQINNTEYWVQIYNYANVVDTLRSQIAFNEGDTSTATRPYAVGELVFINGLLYEAIAPMIAGDSFVVDSNIKKTTVEAVINKVYSDIGDLSDLATTDKSNIVAAINEVITSITEKIAETVGNLDNLATTDKSNIVAAINEVLGVAQTAEALKIHLTSIFNVTELGVVADDISKASENASIINAALAENKYLFFPAGKYYIGDTITMKDKSGIIGESAFTSIIQTTGDFNAVEVPVSVDDTEGVSCSVIITRLFISGTFNATTNNTSRGIYFYNYTFNVTCGRDASAYAQYNNGYALEYRSSIIKDLRVGGFETGIYTDNYTAVLTMSDSMIFNCRLCGIILFGSDMVIDKFYITFNYIGVKVLAESNKISNTKIYMNGIKSNASHVPSENSVGIVVSTQWARNIVLTAVDIQENYENGLEISDGAHDIILNGVICDANGFNQEGERDIGALFYGCHHISGNLICCDKNTTPTQRLGAYVYNSHSFNINYIEYGNINTLNVAGWDVYRMFKHTSNNQAATPTLNASFTSIDTPVAYYDGEHLDIHFKITANNSIAANTEILDLTGIMSQLPTSGYRPNELNFIGFNGTSGAAIILYISGSKLYAGSTFNANDLIIFDVSFRPVYYQ